MGGQLVQTHLQLDPVEVLLVNIFIIQHQEVMNVMQEILFD
jgi:hypothetical protein